MGGNALNKMPFWGGAKTTAAKQELANQVIEDAIDALAPGLKEAIEKQAEEIKQQTKADWVKDYNQSQYPSSGYITYQGKPLVFDNPSPPTVPAPIPNLISTWDGSNVVQSTPGTYQTIQKSAEAFWGAGAFPADEVKADATPPTKLPTSMEELYKMSENNE